MLNCSLFLNIKVLFYFSISYNGKLKFGNAIHVCGDYVRNSCKDSSTLQQVIVTWTLKSKHVCLTQYLYLLSSHFYKIIYLIKTGCYFKSFSFYFEKNLSADYCFLSDKYSKTVCIKLYFWSAGLWHYENIGT